MVSKQTRVWKIEGQEVQFDIFKFKNLFREKAHECGMGVVRYEDTLADALSVDSSTIHNWRCNLNGPSDPDKIYSLEKFWNVEKNTLFREVVMSKTPVLGLTDRELGALKNVYISFKNFFDFYRSTKGFDKELCEWDQVEAMWEVMKDSIESEYIDLKKKLYDALYGFINKNIYEIVADAYIEFHATDDFGPEFDDYDCPEWSPEELCDSCMADFRKIVDPYLLA